MQEQDALRFIYHANGEPNNFIIHPDPNHVGGKDGLTDFGNGFYLSDDSERSYIWGSRNDYYPTGTMNVYQIDNYLLQLNHFVFTDSYHDILAWAMTTGSCLGYEPKSVSSSNFGKVEDEYLLDVDKYHWILSRRVDDRMYTYLDAFSILHCLFKDWLPVMTILHSAMNWC